jgi:inner membrane transporter RhtA
MWRPIVFILASSTSIQFGTAIATTTFDAVGPLNAVWVRGIIGAIIMLGWIRPDVRSLTRDQIRCVLPYALALGAMVTAIYLALVDAPLGIVSAIVMLGPLTVSALGSRGVLDLACVGMAAIGVAVLTLSQGTAGPTSPVGIWWALVGATAFGTYIHAGKRMSKAFDGLLGVAVALPLVAMLQAPLGLAFAKPGVLAPWTLVALAAASVLGTGVPFSLEITALRSLSMATFGLLLAFEPAIAAVAGWTIRGQGLTSVQVAGIGLVIIASAGSLGPRGWTRGIGADNLELMANPTVAGLARVSLFGGLSARDLAEIAAVVEDRDVPAGYVLAQQGEPGNEFFMIADGEVEIRVHGRLVRRLGPGDYLGEIALILGGARTATAVATVSSRLYVLTESDFSALLRRKPRIENRVLTTVAARMRYR